MFGKFRSSPNMLIRILLPNLLGALLTSAVVISACPFMFPTDILPTYELCKREHKECTPIRYMLEDKTKGLGCRVACARQRENLTENLTAYFCEKPEKPCTPYNVSGRKAYSENFERHVMCVQVCHFVEKAERSSASSFSLSSDTKDPPTAIRRINGSFDAFNKCAFKCDGWTKPENIHENIAFFSIPKVASAEGKYFSNPKGGNAFAGLKDCLRKCMLGAEQISLRAPRRARRDGSLGPPLQLNLRMFYVMCVTKSKYSERESCLNL